MNPVPVFERRRSRLSTVTGALLLTLLASVPKTGQAVTTATLIPAPFQVTDAGGGLQLQGGVRVIMAVESSPRVAEIAELLCAELTEATGVSATIGPRSAIARSVNVALRLDSAVVGAEAYRLTIGDHVEIAAADPCGLLWGVQTFLQRVETVDGAVVFRRGEISDQPARGWRGLMLDPVRSWLDLGFLHRTIRVMSAYKLNVLHLHLTDDQAWRFESKAWPKCNRPGEPLYTQAELKELVKFAARYGVEIVPEFDMPGHSMTAVNAYPELDCERQTRTMNEAIFCAGRPFTWEFIDKLVAEAAEIFP